MYFMKDKDLRVIGGARTYTQSSGGTNSRITYGSPPPK
jgi:hypothetical protein